MVFSCPAGAFRAGAAPRAEAIYRSRKMSPKSSFSSGFRSYVRQFLTENLLRFRPSVPWCFPVRQVLFESEQHQEQKQYRSSSKSSSRNSRKMQPKASFSSFFRSYVTHFFSEILVLFRPSVPWCFPVRDVFFDSEQHRAKAVGAAARALAAVAGKCSQMFIF